MKKIFIITSILCSGVLVVLNLAKLLKRKEIC